MVKSYPYKCYVFRQNDPVLDAILPILRSYKATELKKLTNVSTSTLANWKKKKTRRPQFATISAVALATGCSGIDFVDGRPVFRQEPLRRRLKLVK